MTELNCYCVDKMSPCDRTCSQTLPPEPTGFRLVDPQGSSSGRLVVGSFPLERAHQIKMLLESKLIDLT